MKIVLTNRPVASCKSTRTCTVCPVYCKLCPLLHDAHVHSPHNGIWTVGSSIVPICRLPVHCMLYVKSGRVLPCVFVQKMIHRRIPVANVRSRRNNYLQWHENKEMLSYVLIGLCVFKSVRIPVLVFCIRSTRCRAVGVCVMIFVTDILVVQITDDRDVLELMTVTFDVDSVLCRSGIRLSWSHNNTHNMYQRW